MIVALAGRPDNPSVISGRHVETIDPRCRSQKTAASASPIFAQPKASSAINRAIPLPSLTVTKL